MHLLRIKYRYTYLSRVCRRHWPVGGKQCRGREKTVSHTWKLWVVAWQCCKHRRNKQGYTGGNRKTIQQAQVVTQCHDKHHHTGQNRSERKYCNFHAKWVPLLCTICDAVVREVVDLKSIPASHILYNCSMHRMLQDKIYRIYSIQCNTFFFF